MANRTRGFSSKFSRLVLEIGELLLEIGELLSMLIHGANPRRCVLKLLKVARVTWIGMVGRRAVRP